MDDAHTYDDHFTGELPGQELINYPYTNASPQLLSTNKNRDYNRILVTTVESIYPEENDLRRQEFGMIGERQYTMDNQEFVSPYAFINNGGTITTRPMRRYSEVRGKVVVATDCDYVFWRLADVVLLRAECRARLQKATAKDDLDRIRKRAGLEAYAGSTAPEALREEIFNERRRELFGEGQYYFDIVRNGYYREKLYGKFKDLTDADVRNGALYTWISADAF